MHADTGVCEIIDPPENNTLCTISFQSARSGAGGQFLLPDCRATTRVKGMCFFSDTLVSGAQYWRQTPTLEYNMLMIPRCLPVIVIEHDRCHAVYYMNGKTVALGTDAFMHPPVSLTLSVRPRNPTYKIHLNYTTISSNSISTILVVLVV